MPVRPSSWLFPVRRNFQHSNSLQMALLTSSISGLSRCDTLSRLVVLGPHPQCLRKSKEPAGSPLQAVPQGISYSIKPAVQVPGITYSRLFLLSVRPLLQDPHKTSGVCTKVCCQASHAPRDGRLPMTSCWDLLSGSALLCDERSRKFFFVTES